MSEEATPRPIPLAGTLAVAGVIVGAVGLRLLGLEKGVWLDEIFSIQAATNVSLDGLRASDKPPLYVLLLSGWTLLGSSDTHLRLLSVGVAFFTLLVLARWLGRTSVLAAFVGVLLFGTFPILLRYGQEIRGYGLSLLFATIAFQRASGLTAESSQRTRAWIVGFACALGVATHLIGTFVVASVLVFVLVSTERERLPARLVEIAPGIVLPPALTFAVFYFAFLDRIPDDADWWMPRLSWEVLRHTAQEVFGLDVLSAELEQLGVANAPAWALLLAVVLFGLLLVGGGQAGLACLAAALVYWAQLALVSLLGTPIFLYRTALLGLVPFIAFASLHASNTRGALRWTVLTGIALLSLSFSHAWATQLAWTPYERWRDLGSLIAESGEPGDVVLVYPAYAQPAVARYVGTDASLRIRGLDGPAAPLPIDADTRAAMLVVRVDARTRHRGDELEELDRRVTRAIGPAQGSERFGGIVVTRFAAPEPRGRPGAAPLSRFLPRR